MTQVPRDVPRKRRLELAGRGSPDLIGLTLECTDSCLLLEVWDANPSPPVLREADLTAEGGRGLMLVDMLGSKWGQQPAAGGKIVWCELELPAAAGAGRPEPGLSGTSPARGCARAGGRTARPAWW